MNYQDRMQNDWYKGVSHVGSLLWNLLLIYVVMMICRFTFFAENYEFFKGMSWSHFFRLSVAGIQFDTTALLYMNVLYIVLYLFPLHWKENRRYHSLLRGLFVAVNSFGVVLNLMDAAYFPYTNRRTTSSVFSQFANESNLGKIFAIELLHHWYFVLLALLLGYVLYRFYRRPNIEWTKSRSAYYVVMAMAFVLAIPLSVWGIRGGIGRAVRPITISNANKYVDNPIETGIVLNTPFSLLRTLGKKPFVVPHYFESRTEMERYFSPVHTPTDSVRFTPKNVVVLILESFGKEYFGSLNPHLENGTYKGYTPFLDSLIQHSLVFEQSFANGRQSIDGMPSTLSGIPRFVEPFFLTPASLNDLTSIAGELTKKGYYTAFFHGAANGSMGFEAFAHAVGFADYFGRTEYGDDRDFDGNWAIWDEPFLQFYAKKMSSFRQPFMTSVFTASSHHPFAIPARYEERFKGGKLPIERCIQYSDYALKRFFEYASTQDWYKNTLFVITADHTNQSQHPEYQTSLGVYEVPIIFFTPDGTLKGKREGISQQIDIMPTVLNYLGYDRPYISFGCDLLHTPAEETFAVNEMGGIYQLTKGSYVLQFDGEKSIAIYNYRNDPMLKQNLLGKVKEQSSMELQLKAMIQQYMERMNGNQLVIK